MKVDRRTALVVAGIWFLLVGLRGLNIFDIGMANDAILPVIGLIAGVLFVLTAFFGNR